MNKSLKAAAASAAFAIAFAPLITPLARAGPELCDTIYAGHLPLYQAGYDACKASNGGSPKAAQPTPSPAASPSPAQPPPPPAQPVAAPPAPPPPPAAPPPGLNQSDSANPYSICIAQGTCNASGGPVGGTGPAPAPAPAAPAPQTEPNPAIARSIDSALGAQPVPPVTGPQVADADPNGILGMWHPDSIYDPPPAAEPAPAAAPGQPAGCPDGLISDGSGGCHPRQSVVTGPQGPCPDGSAVTSLGADSCNHAVLPDGGTPTGQSTGSAPVESPSTGYGPDEGLAGAHNSPGCRLAGSCVPVGR
jgi:hypothetical protein